MSVVGGLVYPYRRISLARGRISWPFARLTLGAETITLGPRGWLQRVVKPTLVPYRELTHVERVVPPAFLRYAEGLRFRSDHDEWDRLYFSSFPGRVEQVAAALRSCGVEVR
jgi:hypothetical protein